MKKTIFFILVFFFSLALTGQTLPIIEFRYQDTIRVACVGNSVTYGYKIENRLENAYPSQLQNLLGDRYKVRNFGFSGATMLKEGHKPYWETSEFKAAIDFKPHIIIIHLGLNDTDPRNWPNYGRDFVSNYMEMVDTFKSLNLAVLPKVWICKMTPIFSWHKRFMWSTHSYYQQIQKAIEEAASEMQVSLIDLHALLYLRPDEFEDALHPKKEGAGIIAQTVYANISGDFGGLKMSSFFNSGMVLQRDKPIVFCGTANAGEEVQVEFARARKTTKSTLDGKWSVTFEEMEAGGGYSLCVQSSSQEINYTDILIGEVWLCSGQSNMHFPLKLANSGTEDLPLADDGELRFYDMQSDVIMGNKAFSKNDLLKVNQGKFFSPSQWQKSSPENAKDISAIAYYFAKKLRQELKIPIGIVTNAVGGSTTESWISRKALEHDPQLAYILNDFYKNEMVLDWCRERAAVNTQCDNPYTQRHPFMASYLFDTGIRPLENLAFRGVIWYQGESNAHNVALHQDLFSLLVDDWRGFFDNGDFPFYFAQLSSLGEASRKTWTEFRCSQLDLSQKLKNTGMVVTSDLGHPTDVHPKKKKDVGLRFSHLALVNEYGKQLLPQGPTFTKSFKEENSIILYFDFVGEGLGAANNEDLCGFEIAGDNMQYVVAKSKIVNNTVKVWHEDVLNPRSVRYGWKPYTTANLVNSVGFPTSTFITE